jgi:hypothetical protein
MASKRLLLSIAFIRNALEIVSKDVMENIDRFLCACFRKSQLYSGILTLHCLVLESYQHFEVVASVLW